MFFVFYTEEWIFQKYGIKINQIMPHLTLTDNNFHNPPKLIDVAKETEAAIHAYEDLQLVANKSLKELCKNQSLLVFPQCLGEHDDGIEEQFIVQFEGSAKFNDEDKIVSCDDVKIKTGNLMGFIGFSGKGCHGTKLEIRSRFSENADNNKTENNNQDFFLHYMLEKVFKINLFNLNYSYNNSSGLDFIYLIFPYFLKRALNQGLFKTYKTFERNDSAVKGAINVSRHIRQNVPFGGRVAYRSREYTFDNHIMQLIRHTIEYIKTKPSGKSILTQDPDTQKAVSQINEVTNETYSLQKRSKVIFENLKPLNHSYYLDYNYLQQLCLMILNNANSQYSASSSPIYGILFDGAWLWEEYLWIILKDATLEGKNFVHPNNRTGKGGIHLFKKGRGLRYPDFYRKSDNIVLDAKYKALSYNSKNEDDIFSEIKISFKRDDIHQLVTYMYILKAEKGGFIFPDKYRNEYSDDTIRTLPNWLELEGYGKKINGFGLVIPSVKDYNLFKDKMYNLEKNLLNKIDNT